MRSSKQMGKSLSMSSSLVKVGERHRCPRCKTDSVEQICDDEILFCFNCAWSFNVRIFSSVCASEILIRIRKGLKRWGEVLRDSMDCAGEAFRKMGEVIADLQEKIEEAERKKKEQEEKL